MTKTYLPFYDRVNALAYHRYPSRCQDAPAIKSRKIIIGYSNLPPCPNCFSDRKGREVQANLTAPQ